MFEEQGTQAPADIKYCELLHDVHVVDEEQPKQFDKPEHELQVKPEA